MAIKRRDTSEAPRYDVQWRLPDRSKRKKTFKTERDARQFAAKLVTAAPPEKWWTPYIHG